MSFFHQRRNTLYNSPTLLCIQGAAKIGSATEILEILFLKIADNKLSPQTSTTILMTHDTGAKSKSATSRAILVESLSLGDSLWAYSTSSTKSAVTSQAASAATSLTKSAVTSEAASAATSSSKSTVTSSTNSAATSSAMCLIYRNQKMKSSSNIRRFVLILASHNLCFYYHFEETGLFFTKCQYNKSWPSCPLYMHQYLKSLCEYIWL